MQSSERPHVLVIAGSDSSGGAGLVRDVQVISTFGARASCAITSVTAQTDIHVDAVCRLSPEMVRRQIKTALSLGSVHAIKIGMLGTGAIVRAVVEALPDRARVPIVLDPVLSSSSGAALLDQEGVALLRDELIPRSTLVTPNLIEAAVLLGRETTRDLEQTKLAQELLRFGPEYVFLKGGHARSSDALDVLASRAGAPVSLRAKRLNASMRGTGCALSSAIAASLAAGASVEAACRQAKVFVHEQLSEQSSEGAT